MAVERTDIQSVADQLAAEFRPERIILFGSHTRGDTTSDSDVDILVVMDHEGEGWRLAGEMRCRLHTGFPVDVLVQTPEEMEERTELGDPFYRELAREGEVLYESTHA